MEQRSAVVARTAGRYKQAGKKGKGLILAEFIKLTGSSSARTEGSGAPGDDHAHLFSLILRSAFREPNQPAATSR
ncbi:MAG: hypothetical protein LC770_14005, partial [Acidobacteria bacterium]|nr:hypothetical protein [Acidobacteriota bacterium]